ncbi:hypothetical protein GUJ93_ZPchr0002g25478 [Zizania palustris]|uniref:Uncharacterized protein n=1 Tax=Zizania palustris TaxID=103762 RepID=A0A8J5SGC2_ZIZPA|nr:hypothetical protein GUJ93_ZPchr0002g25478 [Zizania palustris]
MPGSEDDDQQTTTTGPSAPMADPVLKGIADLTQVIAGMSVRLTDLEARSRLALFAPMPSGFPYGIPPGYGMAAPSSTESLPNTTPLPIHLIQFPHSPSSIPSLGATSTSISMGIGMATTAPSTDAPLHDDYISSAPDATTNNNMGGPLIHGTGISQGPFPVSASAFSIVCAPTGFAHNTGPNMGVPRFYKLDFSTYDGSEDALNWLNR